MRIIWSCFITEWYVLLVWLSPLKYGHLKRIDMKLFYYRMICIFCLAKFFKIWTFMLMLETRCNTSCILRFRVNFRTYAVEILVFSYCRRQSTTAYVGLKDKVRCFKIIQGEWLAARGHHKWYLHGICIGICMLLIVKWGVSAHSQGW